MKNIDPAKKVRQPHFADGRWYSAAAPRLQTDLQTLFAGVPPHPPLGPLVGLVAPHAGHYFSGHVAAAAFAALSPAAFNPVILIGPDHYGAALGQVAAPEASAWRTPLGDIPVDRDLLQNLSTLLNLRYLPADQEHSLEIELPFLQTALPPFQLLPLMMGSQSPALCRDLAEALVAVLPAAAAPLLVASSDLSHFLDDAAARRLDAETLEFALNFDADGLLRHVETAHRRGVPLACGAGPMAVVMRVAAALGATQANLLKYATSADVSGDTGRVVGYAAVAFSKPLSQ